MGMRSELHTQPDPVAYIECDMADDETLADYRKRVGCARRRWWHVGRR